MEGKEGRGGQLLRRKTKTGDANFEELAELPEQRQRHSHCQNKELRGFGFGLIPYKTQTGYDIILHMIK